MDKFRQAKQDGINAEQRAKRYLSEQGLQFIEQNYRVKVGEIDLIFKQNDTLVFVEVKYRQTASHGYAAEYFTASKRSKMNRAIMCYLQEHKLNLHHTNLRIDVIAIDNQELTWLIGV
jgi:putative endonuclease